MVSCSVRSLKTEYEAKSTSSQFLQMAPKAFVLLYTSNACIWVVWQINLQTWWELGLHTCLAFSYFSAVWTNICTLNGFPVGELAERDRQSREDLITLVLLLYDCETPGSFWKEVHNRYVPVMWTFRQIQKCSKIFFCDVIYWTTKRIFSRYTNWWQPSLLPLIPS